MFRKKYQSRIENKWTKSEIPRSFLEEVCYSSKPTENCKYRQLTDCPRSCEYIEERVRVLNGKERFLRKYPEYVAIRR